MNGKRRAESTYVEVEGYAVDVASLLSLSHRCDPTLCIETGSCCEDHTVVVNTRELARILDVLPLLRLHLSGHGFGRMTEVEYAEIWSGAYALKNNGAMNCPFAYIGESGQLLCALHTIALAEGMEPGDIKPGGCMLWPLSLSGDAAGELSVQPGAYRYPCNHMRTGSETELDNGVRDIVAACFGKGFVRALEKVISEQFWKSGGWCCTEV